MRSDQKELFEQWKDFEICFEIKLAVRSGASYSQLMQSRETRLYTFKPLEDVSLLHKNVHR